METLTIRYMKNLWDNLNLFKFVCVEKSLYFEYYDVIICCGHVEFILDLMASRD